MEARNPPHTALFLFLFLIFSFKLCLCVGKLNVFCPEIEKQSLLNFKRSMKDPADMLSSWGSEANCCEWKGVVCNNLTGHVHQLRLQRNPYVFQGLSGEINPSLLNLKQLRYLDFSLNNFGVSIPSFIGSFTYLEYLNLSFAGFHGRIPHSLGNLSYLHTLDLADHFPQFSWIRNQLDANRLEWLSGLTKLEYLNLNSANLSRATDWAQVINTLPSLHELHFQHCSLEYISSLNDVNITSLRVIDLSQNHNFKSCGAPSWIFQLKNLVYLDLSWNFYEGPIPSISNATKLKYIDLSRNNFNSSIPDWLFLCTDLEFISLRETLLGGTIPNAIGNLSSLSALYLSRSHLTGKVPKEVFRLCKLKRLDLFSNELDGEIRDSFGNMSECFLEALEFLSLDGNHFSGELPDSFGEFKSIRTLSLSLNSLSGAIPISLGKLSSLESLSLDSNKFTGNLPVSLGQLSNLSRLWVEYNMLEGVVTEAHFSKLTNLKQFFGSGNRLTLQVRANWNPPFNVGDLELRSWDLSNAGILSWLESQKDIYYLDLSNAGISGNIPGWIWDFPFDYLNLSHNNLHGNIPYILKADSAYLSSNKFSGLLPSITNSTWELDLSDNTFSGDLSHFICNSSFETHELEILHLGGNELGGELPDCWMRWPSLRYLNLGNNKMFGSIPNSFEYLADLESLNLYGNRFSGQILLGIRNCMQLLKIDLSNNHLDGSIPAWMGTSLLRLQFLILRSNNFSGEISPTICNLNSLQIMDFSDNKLSGIIPSCVNNFTAMATERSLDFRSSYSGSGELIDSALIATKGNQYRYDTILFLVTSIDLSRNNLSGEIPKELTSLVELKSLNLSQNHLTGLIPNHIGDMKQLESLDLSRNSLSGQIPNSFTHMPSLSNLDLSYNNLTGKIPECTQLRGFDASRFVGNDLCGPPLARDCNKDAVPKDAGSDESTEIEWFYVLLSSGYAVGVSIVCSMLVLKKSWREAYFGWLQGMWDKLYVFVYVKWRRLISVIPSSSTSRAN